ncbi:MAG: exodeoxyribonuclease VII small subunit [Polyangiaceae bacterium]|nr:exodeoxyribonuclease VII small subunit [Polyangiaceae bacterium]
MSKRTKQSQEEAVAKASAEGGHAEQAEAGGSFEASIARLSEIVDKLEDGELPLDASLALFEEGVRLARASQARLDLAEKRVEQLLSIDEQGQPIVKTLDHE